MLRVLHSGVSRVTERVKTNAEDSAVSYEIHDQKTVSSLARLLDPATSIFEIRSFSTASSTPSLQRTPMAVPEFSTAFVAYSTCVKFYRVNAVRDRSRYEYYHILIGCACAS